MEQDERCPGCGHPRSESMDPDNEDRYVARRWVCHACKARHDRSRIASEKDPGVLSYSFFVAELEGADA